MPRPLTAGIGVDGGDKAARDPRADERVGARAGAAVVAAGLQRDVGGGAAGALPGGCAHVQRYDLGVVALVVAVGAFAQNLTSAPDQDAAHLRVGRSEPHRRLGEAERALHVPVVGRHG